MDKHELLCRAWIECDPNRRENADDIIPPVEDSDGNTCVTELTGQPRWKWFSPRAEALEKYLNDNGYDIVAKKTDA